MKTKLNSETRNGVVANVWSRSGDLVGRCLVSCDKWEDYEAQSKNKEGFVVASDWLTPQALSDINCPPDAVVWFS